MLIIIEVAFLVLIIVIMNIFISFVEIIIAIIINFTVKVIIREQFIITYRLVIAAIVEYTITAFTEKIQVDQQDIIKPVISHSNLKDKSAGKIIVNFIIITIIIDITRFKMNLKLRVMSAVFSFNYLHIYLGLVTIVN